MRSPTSLWQSTKYVSLRALTASTPSATAMWVLPTPGLPTRTTFSRRPGKPSAASSSATGRSIEGWKEKSKSASVFTYGKFAFSTLRSRSRALTAATCASVISIRAWGNVLAPEATRAAYSAAEEAIASMPGSSRLLRARSGALAPGIGALTTRRPLQGRRATRGSGGPPPRCPRPRTSACPTAPRRSGPGRRPRGRPGRACRARRRGRRRRRP